jgi:tRNA-splicing ligase RtcB (3'-phosphate/5'-hydroxy nucleic acid ligase)
MGTASFHTLGRGCEAALGSSSHGAGRRLSRTEARRSVSMRQMRRQMQSVWFDHRGTERLRDEAPAAYKDIYAVMRAQKELTRAVRELRPILCYKGWQAD